MILAPGLYRMRNGGIARIYAIDGEPHHPATGTWRDEDGTHADTWTIDGRYFCEPGRESDFDLIRRISDLPAEKRQ